MKWILPSLIYKQVSSAQKCKHSVSQSCQSVMSQSECHNQSLTHIVCVNGIDLSFPLFIRTEIRVLYNNSPELILVQYFSPIYTLELHEDNSISFGLGINVTLL